MSVRPIFIDPTFEPEPSADAEIAREPGRIFPMVLAGSTLVVAAVLLFANLGHYALWDDEALTALTAQSVWQTGDTGAVVGHNIIAFSSGLMLKGLKDRSSPPLQFYIVAPFVGLFGNASWAARFPMALIGLLCVATLLWWLHQEHAALTTRIVFVIALLGNVSFFLYCRQCRYYSLSTFLPVAIAYCYLHLRRTRDVVFLLILLILLLTSNYMIFVITCAVMAVDYVVWGRHFFWIKGVHWLIILAPVIIIGLLVLSVWDPRSIISHGERGSWISDRGTLFWWYLRDSSACEFCSPLLLLIAPFVAWWKKEQWILRALLALTVAYMIDIITNPQASGDISVANVRYIVAIMPLAMVVEVLTLKAICPRFIWAIPAAVLFFGTNLLQGSYFNDPGDRVPLGSTFVRYVHELINPPTDCYRVTSNWINEHAARDSTILVEPGFAALPLTFHAPSAIYGWQLDAVQMHEPQYASLPPIMFRDQVPPDYVVIFGMDAAPTAVVSLGNIKYSVAASLDVFGRDRFRPEIFWRAFADLPPRGSPGYGVTIFQRILSQ